MALITCPECKREISDKAPSCPGCGALSPKQETAQKVKVAGATIIGGVARWLQFVMSLAMWGAICLLARIFVVGETGLQILVWTGSVILLINYIFPNLAKRRPRLFLALVALLAFIVWRIPNWNDTKATPAGPSDDAAGAPTKTTPTAQLIGGGEGGLTFEALENARYDCNATLNSIIGPVTLTDGKFVAPSDPHEKAGIAIMLMGNRPGPPLVAFGDLNADGRQDAAVVLWYGGGGSGIEVFLFVMLDDDGSPKCTASAQLGDRPEINFIDIEGQKILVDVVERWTPGYSGPHPRRINAEYKLVKSTFAGESYRLVGRRQVNERGTGLTYGQLVDGLEPPFKMGGDENVYNASAPESGASLQIRGPKSDVTEASLVLSHLQGGISDRTAALVATFIRNATLGCEGDLETWAREFVSRIVRVRTGDRSVKKCADRQIVLWGTTDSRSQMTIGAGLSPAFSVAGLWTDLREVTTLQEGRQEVTTPVSEEPTSPQHPATVPGAAETSARQGIDNSWPAALSACREANSKLPTDAFHAAIDQCMAKRGFQWKNGAWVPAPYYSRDIPNQQGPPPGGRYEPPREQPFRCDPFWSLCGGHSCCPPGTKCCFGPNTCCPTGSQCCVQGRCCPEGTYCVTGGCRSLR